MSAVGVSDHSPQEDPCVCAHTACSEARQMKWLHSAQHSINAGEAFLICLVEEKIEDGLDFLSRVPRVWCTAHRVLQIMSRVWKAVCDIISRVSNVQANPLQTASLTAFP